MPQQLSPHTLHVTNPLLFKPQVGAISTDETKSDDELLAMAKNWTIVGKDLLSVVCGWACGGEGALGGRGRGAWGGWLSHGGGGGAQG